MLKITIEIRQTLLSELLLGIASFLYFYKLINYQLYLQIIDMAILDIKTFKYRIGNGKWRTLKVGDGM